jgi:hypothetical protein
MDIGLYLYVQLICPQRFSHYFVQAKSGPAYMFVHAMNIIVGQKVDRKLMTGLYTVADIYCSNCGETLGWKYVRAYEVRDKFKEGKFIIERAKIAKEY